MDRPDATFGDLVDRKARELGLNDRQISPLLGLLGPDRRQFDHTQVKRLRSNQRRQVTAELVSRFIVALEMSEEEADQAWMLAGLLPPGTTVEDVADLRYKIARRERGHERSRRRQDRQLPEPGNPGQLRPVGRAA